MPLKNTVSLRYYTWKREYTNRLFITDNEQLVSLVSPLVLFHFPYFTLTHLRLTCTELWMQHDRLSALSLSGVESDR